MHLRTRQRVIGLLLLLLLAAILAPLVLRTPEQVRLALARERIETEIESTVATPPASRRRLALHARRTQDGRVVLGFKARRPWRLVEVKACPVAAPRIVAALPPLTRVAGPLALMMVLTPRRSKMLGTVSPHGLVMSPSGHLGR